MRLAFLVLYFGSLLSLAAASPDGTTPLHTAVYEDRTENAIGLLAAGADPSAANRYGVTPLKLACLNGNAEIIAALLKAGAEVDVSYRGKETPLMVAARTGKPEAVQVLLAAGAPESKRDEKGQTALMWAAAEGHAEVVEILIQSGAEIQTRLKSGFTAMYFATRNGHAEVVEVLLDHGIDVNEEMEIDGGGRRAPRKGTSALILALENGHFELAAKLLAHGADANDVRTGFTPLHVMSWVRKPKRGDGIDGAPPPRGTGNLTSLQFVEKLIEHGADVNAQPRHGASPSSTLGRPGATPFLYAARTADLPLMKLLIEHGADFRLPNSQGRTPLLAAAGVALGPEADEAASENDAVEAVRFLIALGADIDVIDKTGDTVMHAAAYKQSPKLVNLFSEAGANIEIWNHKNRRGWTPLLIAQGYRYGNFKPSSDTIAAISDVMLAEGVTPPAAPPRSIAGEKNYSN